MHKETKSIKESDPDIYSLTMLILVVIQTVANIIAPVLQRYYERRRRHEVWAERNRIMLDSINRLQYDLLELKTHLAEVKAFIQNHNIDVEFAPCQILIGNKNMAQELSLIKRRVISIMRDVDSSLTKIALRIETYEQDVFEEDRRKLQEKFQSLITTSDYHKVFEKGEEFANEIMDILERMKGIIGKSWPR